MLSVGDRTLQLVYDLLPCTDRDAYLEAAATRLRLLFESDLCLWTAIDLILLTSDVLVSGGNLADNFGERLAAAALDHPAIASYLADPSDLAPRRVTDLVGDDEWFSSPIYAELFREHRADRQLSMVVLLEPPARGEGWVLMRSGQDYMPAEMELAQTVLPALTALDRLFRARTGGDTNPAPVAKPTEARRPTLLTLREAEVLHLHSSGLTSDAIGRVLGISRRTVHKHLEHAYGTLVERDRVRAVNAARSLRMVPGRSPTSQP